MIHNPKCMLRSLLVSGFIFGSLLFVVCASGFSLTTPRARSVPMSSSYGDSDDAARSSTDAKVQSMIRGQNVLVTGASGGLGRALALQMAHAYARTLILSGRNADALCIVADECHSIHPDIVTHVLTADLASPEAVQQLATKTLEVTSGRGVDILINNGGISSRSRFVDTTLEVDQQLMQVNFFAGVALAKAILPGMIERGHGKLIWISSVQGLMGIPNRTSYAASKFAVQGYCEALRGEVATAGVTVHVASPGYIRTNLSRSAITGNGRPHGQMDASTASGKCVFAWDLFSFPFL